MFLIYGKKKCGFCKRAVEWLRDNGYDFQYYSMDEKLEELQQLSTIYNWKTVPMIIQNKDGQELFIGGYDDLIKTMQVQTPEKND